MTPRVYGVVAEFADLASLVAAAHATAPPVTRGSRPTRHSRRRHSPRPSGIRGPGCRSRSSSAGCSAVWRGICCSTTRPCIRTRSTSAAGRCIRGRRLSR